MNRRVFITLLLALVTSVWVAAPAVAAPPEVTKKSCDALGGIFTKTGNVKECRYTTEEITTRNVSNERPYCVEADCGTLTALYLETTRQVFVTVLTQKGSGPVTTEGPFLAVFELVNTPRTDVPNCVFTSSTGAVTTYPRQTCVDAGI